MTTKEMTEAEKEKQLHDAGNILLMGVSVLALALIFIHPVVSLLFLALFLIAVALVKTAGASK